MGVGVAWPGGRSAMHTATPAAQPASMVGHVPGVQGARQAERPGKALRAEGAFSESAARACSGQKGPAAASLRASRERQVSAKAPRWHASASCTEDNRSAMEAEAAAAAEGCGGRGAGKG